MKAPLKIHHKGKSHDDNSSSGTKVGPNAPTSNPMDAECYYSFEKGHWKRSCPKYLQDINDGKINPSFVGIYGIQSNKSSHVIYWVLDTGCGFQMCSDLQCVRRNKDVEHGKINLIMGNRRRRLSPRLELTL